MNNTPVRSKVNTMKKLTSTSYVLLGQLGIQPWSAYALTKHFQRSLLKNFWPRAESHIYDEIKNLACHKLVTAKDEVNGKRQRSIYTITRKGRQALNTWVGESGKSRIVEWEQLAKISYADYGTKEQMLDHLQGVRADALERVRHMYTLVCKTDPPAGRVFRHRSHIGILTGELVLRELEMILAWVEWVEAEIVNWPDTQYSEVGEQSYQQGMTSIAKRTEAILLKYES